MPLAYQVGSKTDKGRARSENEDHYGIPPQQPAAMAWRQARGDLYLVADGMGGYHGGATASIIAAQEILNAYYADPNPNLTLSLRTAIERANTVLRQKALSSEALSKMGTTVVAALLQRDGRVVFANIGDSRGYLIPAQGPMRQVTQDHSWVDEQVRAGILTPEQARTHPRRNIITRSLGQKSEVEVDVFDTPALVLRPGDALLLCSDGLTNVVTDQEIAEVVRRLPPAQAAEQLVNQANERGGPDNITVVVVKAQAQAPVAADAKQPAARTAGLPRWLVAGAAVLAAVILLAVTLVATGVWPRRGEPTAVPAHPSTARLATSTAAATAATPSPSPPPTTLLYTLAPNAAATQYARETIAAEETRAAEARSRAQTQTASALQTANVTVPTVPTVPLPPATGTATATTARPPREPSPTGKPTDIPSLTPTETPVQRPTETPGPTPTDTLSLALDNIPQERTYTSPQSSLRYAGIPGARAAGLSSLLPPAQCDPAQILTVTATIFECQVTFSATLTGTVPFDYLWQVGTQSSTVTTPTFDLDASGTYPYTLTVSNCGGSDVFTETVDVTCAPPLVLPPTIPPVALNPGQEVTRALALTNTGGVTLPWTLTVTPPAPWLAAAPLSGALAAGGSATVTLTLTAAPTSTGDYDAMLVLYGASPPVWQDEVSVTLVVTDSCLPPGRPAFSWVPAQPVSGEPVTFTAHIEGKPPFTLTWDLGDGTTLTETGMRITHTYEISGRYPVVLTATNCASTTASVSHTVAVATPCSPVTIAGVLSETSGCAADFAIDLDGSPPYTFVWDFAFTQSTAPTPMVIFPGSGSYPYTLTVANCGGSDVFTGQITMRCSFAIHLPWASRNYPLWQRQALAGQQVRDMLPLPGTNAPTYLGTSSDVYQGGGCAISPTVSLGFGRKAQTLVYHDGSVYAGTGDANEGVWLYQGGWTAVNNGLGDLRVWALESCGGNLYAGTDTGIYYSPQPAATPWIYASEGLSGTALVINTLWCDDDGTLYAGTWGSGVYRRDGNVWRSLGLQGLVGDPARRVWAVLAVDASTFYIGTEGGLYESSSGGSSWSRVGIVPEIKVYALTRDATGIVYAGTWGSGVFARLPGDGWQRWGTLGGNGASVRALEFLPGCDYLYAGTLDGVWRYPLE